MRGWRLSKPNGKQNELKSFQIGVAVAVVVKPTALVNENEFILRVVASTTAQAALILHALPVAQTR